MAQTLIKNGNIHIMDVENTIVDAILWEDGVIKEVGTYEQVCKSKKDDCTELDAEGKLVLPAFHDSHLHLLGYCESLDMVDLYLVESIQQMQEKVKEFIEKQKCTNQDVKSQEENCKWICGRGWNQDYFPDGKMPTREDLDQISTQVPIVLTRACGHMLVVNSKALQLCQITKDTPQVEDGAFELDANGEPNGIFREGAMGLITHQIPEKTVEDLKKFILIGQEELFQQGITSVQSDDFWEKKFETVIQAFRELEQEGKLKVHVYEQSNLGSLSELKRYVALGLHADKGGKHYRLGPLKILGDGSLGARTAYMLKPYHDAPETTGIAYFTKQELYEYMKYAHDHDMQIAIHCIGDGMLDMALDCFEQIQKENPKEDMRHGIVHCQITSKEQLKRIKDNELVVYMQPIFLNYDMQIVESRVGKELASSSYNWKSLKDLGVHCSVGSDCPVEPFHTMNNIYSAVTRKNLQGQPDEGYYPEQCLTVEETIRAFTVESAYTAKEETKAGTLEKGMRADLVMLDRDLFTCEPEEIRDTAIVMTISDGEIVYQK